MNTPPSLHSGWKTLVRTSIAQLIAVFGENAVLATALPLVAWDRTHSAKGVAAALGTVMLGALASLPAGVWVGRRSTRLVLIGAGVLRLVLAVILAVAAQSKLTAILSLVFLVSLVDSFYMPALKSAVPDWLAGESLASGNALLEATDIPAQILAPPAAVALYVRFGFTGPAALLAGCYLASLGVLLANRWEPRQSEHARTEGNTFAARVQDTLSRAWRSSVVRSTLIGCSIGMVAAGAMEALTLPFLVTHLGAPESALGTLGALLGMGMALGAGVMGWADLNLRDTAVLSGAAALVAAAVAIFATGISFIACGVAMVLAGAGMVGVHVASDTILQTVMPDDARAGVLGLTHTIEACGLLIGLGLGAVAGVTFGAARAIWVPFLLLVTGTLFAKNADREDVRALIPPIR